MKTLTVVGVLCLLAIPAMAQITDPGAVPTDQPAEVHIGQWKIGLDYPVAGLVLEGTPGSPVLKGSLQTIPGVALMGRYHYNGQEVFGIGGGMYVDAFLTVEDNQKVNVYPSVIVSVLKWINIGVTWKKMFLGGNLPIGK